MSAKKIATMVLLVAVASTAALPSAANGAAPAPAWKLTLNSRPTNFAPGEVGTNFRGPAYEVEATNVGGAKADGPITITNTLPGGLTPLGARIDSESSCLISGQTVSCTKPNGIGSSVQITMRTWLSVDASLSDPSTLIDEATISSPGVAPATVSTTTTISSTPASFGFIEGRSGLDASLTEADGAPTLTAGSHPSQFTVTLAWRSLRGSFSNGGTGNLLGAGGGARDTRTYLPPGLIVNPTATPVLCTEAQFEISKCPDASALGKVNAEIGFVNVGHSNDPLYNLKPPPGYASSFGFDPANTGLHVHILGGLRAGDYTLGASVNDITTHYSNPAFGVQLQLWGDPSSPTHDHIRGLCTGEGATCPVPPQETPLLSMPTSCQGSMDIEASMDSWSEPGNFLSRSAPFADLNGNPTGVVGCEALNYSEATTKPTLKARPTTSVADAPSGLEVDLHIPQSENLGTLAEAHLKEATVTLPEGLSINPSGANGLAGCSSAQIGVDPGTGVANGNQPTCPDASKIGTLEVDTPLLDHPLPGSVYIATPHDNPFDSLLAIYLVVNDKPTGTLVKLAGHVQPDPQTGRLTTTFTDNPQLPFEDFKLDFFGGPAGTLRTPATCGTYSTTSELTPWSGAPAATPRDDYEISQAPGGGSCPTSKGALPNVPDIDAGSVTPIAGAVTPAVVTLRRDDGSQEFSAVDLILPPGMTGKLAGVGTCPDSALAEAASRPGRQEEANPSCPTESRVGRVDVAAGAGPAPYHAQGTAYLTGPYKGAPLGMAIVTPATAGPYDLGTVVVRVALHLDPNTGQITAITDEIPHILEGIPLDIRTAAIKLDRPDFTRNGTSCNPFAFTGRLTSTLGQAAPLAERFQLGECGRLAFKPKLGIRLFGGTKRGAHPALRGVLQMPEGANVASASVALPHSEFLDQAHIGTVCTRVQFAADECPAASIYGQAMATSPLVDYSLQGPVYLRSSDNELPDLVAALRGPASQPVEIDVVGRIDSVRGGGIRTTFNGVPDLPVGRFVLSMAGGRKGLLQNSTNICRGLHRATAEFDGQNGKIADLSPPLRNGKCGKAKRRHGKQGRKAHRASLRHLRQVR